MNAGGPTWATDTTRDDFCGGWIHTRALDAGDGVTVELVAWEDDQGGPGTVEATLHGTLPVDPVGLLRVATAISEAAGLLL